jgi:hypothetical protein
MATNANTSLVRVDIQQLVADLQAELVSSNTPTRTIWQDMLADSTGQSLLEFIATNTTFAIFANERALQEAFPNTARLKSSIFAAMRMDAVRLTRKIPATCTVTITKPNDGLPYAIPAYSVFNSPSGALFNRTAILFSSTQTSQSVNLYLGTVVNAQVQGTGNPFQTFISTDQSFTVSDVDVQVSIAGSDIPVVTDGLWHYAAAVSVSAGTNTLTAPQPAVQDRTTKLGQLELNFGNNNFATMPGPNETVSITYATCNGVLGNNPSFNGTTITYNSNANYITAVATSGLVGGADQANPSTYQKVGPALFAAFDRAVNNAEYNAVAVTYPGVIDAKLDGQRTVAPNIVTYMNAIRTALLTTSVWNTTQQQNFKDWFEARSMDSTNLYFVTPVPVNYQIQMSIFCDPTADLVQAQTNAENALQTYTALGLGSIGQTVYMSDITNAAMQSDPAIQYTKLLGPTSDLATSFNLTDLNVVETALGTGSSVGGTYLTYFVSGISAYTPGASAISASATTTSGESLPIAISYTVSASGGTNVEVSWDPIGGYEFVRIYVIRGTSGNVGLLAQIPGSSSSYTDTWSTPNTSVVPPQIDSFGIYYPNCTNIVVTPNIAVGRSQGLN